MPPARRADAVNQPLAEFLNGVDHECPEAGVKILDFSRFFANRRRVALAVRRAGKVHAAAPQDNQRISLHVGAMRGEPLGAESLNRDYPACGKAASIVDALPTGGKYPSLAAHHRVFEIAHPRYVAERARLPHPFAANGVGQSRLVCPAYEENLPDHFKTAGRSSRAPKMQRLEFAVWKIA